MASPGCEGPVASQEAADPPRTHRTWQRAERWSALADAPHIRDHCGAAIVKDKLYLVGGRNTSYRDSTGQMNFFSQTELALDCYDFKKNNWTVLNSRLPLGSGGGTVACYHNKLYYMGGERATKTKPNAPRKNVFVLDPNIDNGWKEIASLNKPRNGTASTVINDKIYLLGGSGGGPGGPPPPPMNGKIEFNQAPPPRPDNQNGVKSKIVIEEFKEQ